MAGRSKWIDLYNSSPGGRVGLSMFTNTDTKLHCTKEQGVKFKERKGVWWPLAMAEAKLGP